MRKSVTTDPRILAWLKADGAASRARAKADLLGVVARTRANFPSKTRPATPADIKEGAIIWYARHHDDDYAGWHIVADVIDPRDDFKAYWYRADDGCRYGLFGAVVEIP